MTTEKVVVETPYVGNLFLHSDEGNVAPIPTPRRRRLFCKITTAIFVALALFTINAVFADSVAQNTSSLPNEEREAILDMIAQINHINWVVCTIKSYNNILVLEEEYEKISPGNLDLSRIPNEETLKRITRMLDTLYSLRRDDRQMKRWREDFKERRRREQKTYLLKASKQAVDALTEQAKECCSLWSWASNPAGSILNVAHTAFNMSHYSVSLYNDYDNFIYELDKSASDKQFDFDSAKLDLLHKQNKEILEDQWSFIRRYKLDDQLRVSDVDIKILLKCLKTENHEQLYIRLLPMRERFSLFPEYWYYLSCVAMETGHFKEGIEACNKFFEVNRRIFRDDPMEGTVAFNKAFMLSKTDANKQEVRKCLERAWKNNIIRGDWQLDYLVAIMYKGVFNEQAKAEMMLEHAVALIEQQSREQTRYSGKASVSIKEGLRNCRNALHELRGEALEPIEDVPEQESVEDFASKLFDEEYGSGLLVLSNVARSYYVLLLPIANIPELKPKFTIYGETRDVGLFSVSRHKRVLKEAHRRLWENNNVAVYVFQACRGMAFDQFASSCSNGEITIYFTGKVDGYSGIQHFSDNVSYVARETIKECQMDIHWDQCFSVCIIEKLKVGNKTYTRRNTRKR